MSNHQSRIECFGKNYGHGIEIQLSLLREGFNNKNLLTEFSPRDLRHLISETLQNV